LVDLDSFKRLNASKSDEGDRLGGVDRLGGGLR
jgi:hypothetical protein